MEVHSFRPYLYKRTHYAPCALCTSIFLPRRDFTFSASCFPTYLAHRHLRSSFLTQVRVADRQFVIECGILPLLWRMSFTAPNPGKQADSDANSVKKLQRGAWHLFELLVIQCLQTEPLVSGKQKEGEEEFLPAVTPSAAKIMQVGIEVLLHFDALSLPMCHSWIWSVSSAIGYSTSSSVGSLMS